MNRAQLTEELVKKRDENDVLKTLLITFKSRAKTLVIVASMLFIAFAVVTWQLYKVKSSPEQAILKSKLEKTKEQLEEARNNLSFVSITKDDFMKDLKHNYPETSLRTKKKILNAIMDESSNYDINPLILYSVFFVESSFRPWIEHTPTNIIINKKTTKIRAVGLGGVVWEWWGDKLKSAGIAETRGDLFDPETNVRATAFIYNEMYKMPIHKSAKNKDESALLRYFGGDYPIYLQRIDAKISKFVRPNLYRKD